MAIKAKERVHNKQMSGKTSLIICVILIAYITFYYVMSRTHPAIARPFSLFSTIILAIALIILLRFDSTMYDLLLTHERLEIERRVTVLYHHIVAEIPISHIIGLWHTSQFTEDALVTGKTFKYTVSPRELDNLKFYTLLYNRNGETCRVDFQCSDSFYRSLRHLISK